MIEKQLRSMTEQDIRARFRCAPAYYLQAKLDNKRCLRLSEDKAAREAESRWEAVMTEQSQWQAALPEPAGIMPRGADSLNLSLPGLDVLDAALSECEPAPERETASAAPADTQQAILEAALEDYAQWPVLSESEAAPETAREQEPEAELARKLSLVLDTEPDLDLLLDPGPALEPKEDMPRETPAVVEPAQELELELELILDSVPELEMAFESEPSGASGADNVTRADFGQRPPRTVPVVSVVMDQKRPNMVRVVGKSTRLAG